MGTGVLEPLPSDGTKLSCESYVAPRRAKCVLMGIGEELDHAHKERVRKFRKVLLGNEEISSSGEPLVLFHGPPGTGTTPVMRVIAWNGNAQSAERGDRQDPLATWTTIQLC